MVSLGTVMITIDLLSIYMMLRASVRDELCEKI